MSKPQFIYVTYIATTPEKLWQALTTPEFSSQYWFGRWVESSWKVGGKVTYWQSRQRDLVDFTGTVLRCEAPRVLSYTFGESWSPGSSFTEKASRVTFELEALGALVKLTMTHDDFAEDSKVLPGVRNGWPAILSGLKTVLESGRAFPLDVKTYVAAHGDQA